MSPLSASPTRVLEPSDLKAGMRVCFYSDISGSYYEGEVYLHGNVVSVSIDNNYKGGHWNLSYDGVHFAKNHSYLEIIEEEVKDESLVPFTYSSN